MKYLAVIIVILLNTCNANNARKLREGDILFRETRNNALSDAISDVTDSTGNLRFSHVGNARKGCVPDAHRVVRTTGQRGNGKSGARASRQEV